MTEKVEWNCFKGNPERSGYSDTYAPDTLYLEWKVDTGSKLVSSPVVKSTNVYQITKDEILCIDLDTGNVVWKSSIPAYDSTPVISEDKVIVVTNCGIFALFTKNGNLAWKYEVPRSYEGLTIPESLKDSYEDYIISCPVVCDGKVVVGLSPYFYPVAEEPIEKENTKPRREKLVICLDETNGNEVWYVETSKGVISSPCVAHGKVFVTSSELICIDLETGDILWNHEDLYPWDLSTPLKKQYYFYDSTPSLYHGILIGSNCLWRYNRKESRMVGGQKIVAIDQYTGEIFWEWMEEEGILTSSPALYEGKIYYYSYNGILQCISLFDGEELWKTPISQPQEYETEDKLWPSPSVADDKIYIGSTEGVFHCLDAHTGEMLWKYETGGPIYATPAIVEGKVLISSTDGSIYCFGIDPETYKMKAEKYLEDGIYDRAEEFFVKAYEYATTDEKKDIEESLDLISIKMEEYQKRTEMRSEAERLMDEADKIMWNDEFIQAKALYVKAKSIFEELNDELLTNFCESRLDYIQKRIDLYPIEKRLDEIEKKISEQSWVKRYWWLVIILICVGVISVYVLRKY